MKNIGEYIEVEINPVKLSFLSQYNEVYYEERTLS